jgi:hypothetical protein
MQKKKDLIDYWLPFGAYPSALSIQLNSYLFTTLLNQLLSLYNSTCNLYGLYLMIFIYLNS